MGGRARHGSVGWGPERDAGARAPAACGSRAGPQQLSAAAARARQGGQDVLSVMGQLLIGLLIP